MIKRSLKARVWVALLSLLTAGPAAAQTSYRGVIQTLERAVLSSDVGGRIVSIPFQLGDRFQKQDVVAEFDCRMNRIKRDMAAAETEAAKKKHESSARLAGLNSIGQLNVDLALLEWRKLQATLAAADLTVEQCKILAPFDGRVVRRVAQEFEQVAAGQAIIEIVGTKRLEVETAVPVAVAQRLQAGRAFRLVVDETGTRVECQVIAVAPVIDPVSQLVTVRGRILGGVELVPGTSGNVEFD